MSKTPSSVTELLSEMVAFDTVNEYMSQRHFPEKAMMEQLENYALQWGFESSRLPIARNPEDLSFNLLITYQVKMKVEFILLKE